MLQESFRSMGRVLIAYSGGVDSTLLLKVGTDVLNGNCLGVIGESASLASTEYQEALNIARKIGAHVEVIKTDEMSNAEYLKNDNQRCFYCKSELFGKLHQLAIDLKVKYIVDGNNLDDTGDYRPGMEAARMSNIRSPLIESGFTKADIRQLGRQLNLPNWDKPAQPCLSSRIAYGIAVTPDILMKIDQAESVLRKMDFRIVRVRYLTDSVSVEVGPDETERLLSEEVSKQVLAEFARIGLKQIHLDQEGYVSGKLNRQHLSIE